MREENLRRWTGVNYPPCFNNRRSSSSKLFEQQTNTLAQAMHAMADMVRTLQADRVPVKEKELMTTKRALHDAAELLWQG